MSTYVCSPPEFNTAAKYNTSFSAVWTRLLPVIFARVPAGSTLLSNSTRSRCDPCAADVKYRQFACTTGSLFHSPGDHGIITPSLNERLRMWEMLWSLSIASENSAVPRPTRPACCLRNWAFLPRGTLMVGQSLITVKLPNAIRALTS